LSLAQALIKSERIGTTLARAKEAQRLVEPLITLGKKGTLASRRRARQLLNDPILVRKLFAEVAPRFAKRAGGYTRILHDGIRAGDGARLVILELVELSEARKPKTVTREKKKEVEPEPERAAPAGVPTPPEAGKPQEEVQAPKPKKAEVAPKAPRPPRPKAPPKPKLEKGPRKTEPKPEKPKGFLGGLRNFFKRRENP